MWKYLREVAVVPLLAFDVARIRLRAGLYRRIAPKNTITLVTSSGELWARTSTAGGVWTWGRVR